MTDNPYEFKHLLHEFVELSVKKRELTEDIDEVKARLAHLDAFLLDRFADLGITNMTVEGEHGKMSVHTHRRFVVSKKKTVTTQDVCDVLQKTVFAELVQDRYTPMSLQGAVRELVDDGKEVPPELLEVLNVMHITNVRATSV